MAHILDIPIFFKTLLETTHEVLLQPFSYQTFRARITAISLIAWMRTAQIANRLDMDCLLRRRLQKPDLRLCR